jgi:molybdate transport system substrate-binding protein
MEYFKVYDQVKDKLVLGENISQAAQFIESGACDIGIIALSLAVTPVMQSKGMHWEIPAGTHLPLEQGVVILKSSKQQESAKQFLAFIKGVQGQEIMRRNGFTQPN